jgi:S-adenosylmethionine decarboxylase
MAKKTKRSIQWVKETKKSQNKAKLSRDKQKYAGTHLIVEFWNGKIIEDSKKIEEILLEAVKKAKSIALKTAIYKFSPQGITGVVLLAESHIALHSWPEANYLAIDIFTCGNKAMPFKAFEYLKKALKPEKVEIKALKRGKL